MMKKWCNNFVNELKQMKNKISEDFSDQNRKIHILKSNDFVKFLCMKTVENRRVGS